MNQVTAVVHQPQVESTETPRPGRGRIGEMATKDQWRISHAAVNSQLRKSSQTPSQFFAHPRLLFVYNQLRPARLILRGCC